MKHILYTLLVAFILSSCVSQKKISYLQDMQTDFSMKIEQSQDVKIQIGDWISILVNSKDVELAQMFNLPIVSNAMVGNGTYTGGTNRLSGYLVDSNGNIDFPQLGSLKVEDLTLTQLSKLIKDKLVNDGLINDATVSVQYVNFKISVIGEVANPGAFNIQTGRITILEALSMAGDMTIYGKRDNVKVIREEDGVRTIANIDLRSKQLFDSPCYYLHQNDVIYVEPNKARAGQREINANRTLGTFVSILSVLISLSVLIFK